MLSTVTNALRTLLVCAVLMAFAIGPAHAQDSREVTGTVTDAQSGTPLPGVNISVQGTMTGTTTNVDGEYSINVPGPDAVLVFSFVGYRTQEITVGDQSVIDVALQEDIEQLGEVVVVGYGTQRRQDISGSVSSVDVEEASVGQVTSPQELIQGRISGVNVISNSGEPGAGVSVRIRGTTSISAGSDPLYVIDGVPINNTNLTPGGASQGGVTSSSTTNPLALLNPQDIESIQVLKDAAATAIYGSQGANGVILIQTKSGEAGTVQVDYSGKLTAGTFANKLDLLSGDEYRQAIQDVLGQSPGSGDTSTDWQDATTRSPIAHNHNLSFSGGSEATSYRASLSYLDQQGLLENSGIERINGRVNASHSTFEDRVRLNLNLTGSYLKRNHAFYAQGAGFEGGAIKGMIGFDPRQPVVSEDGEFNEFSRNIRNPVALLQRITDITDQSRILGNFSTEVDVTNDLTAKGTVGIDFGEAIRRSYIPGSGPPLWFGTGSNGLARQARRSLSNIVTQATLNYSTEFAEGQRFGALAGAEYKRETFQNVGTEGRDFITDALQFNNLSGAGEIAATGTFSGKQLVEQISFFGRANYNYNDKYLLEGTLRRDGSSVFGENEQFAWFPSGSIAWRISNESFMEDISSITELKLRASVGLSGNQAVPPYQTLATLSPSDAFTGIFGTGESEVTGVAQERAPNPDLKWEETTEFNIGLDFIAGPFDGAVEFYQKTTTDLLLDVRVPPPAPSAFVLENIGEVQNTGVELSLNAFVIENQDMSLSLGGTISSNRNEIKDLGGRGFIDHSAVSGAGQTGVFAQRLQEGHPIGSFYGPVFLRINEAGEEVFATEDGGETTALGEAKRDFIGNPIPDFTYSLNTTFRYQSFDVSVFLRGEQGRELFNNTALEFQTKSNLGQGIGVLADALTDGTNESHLPQYSSRWIEDASYLRLDKLTIGYTLPNATTFGLRRARVYVSGQNLFVITPYDGYDPEVNTNVNGADLGFRTLARPTRGVDYTSYPRSRTFTFGVEVGI